MHAISVARRVMERTPHTLLVGEGATRFARDQGFPQRDLLTPESAQAWRDWLKTANYHPEANVENRIGRTPGGKLERVGPDSGAGFDTVPTMAISKLDPGAPQRLARRGAREHGIP